MLRAILGDWGELLLDPRRALRIPMRNVAGAIVLWGFAKVVLEYFDPGYLERGALVALPGHGQSK